VRKRSIGSRQDRSRSSRSLRRAITFPENERGIIKEKRVKTKSREVKRGY
jgi:predicted GIY-YIG superfamily endonuclease